MLIPLLISLAFTKQEFNTIISKGLLFTLYLGLASLGLTVARAVAASLLDTQSTLSKLRILLVTVLYSSIAVLIFIASAVSYKQIFI